MPVLDDLGPVVVALMAALIAISADVLIWAIGQAIGKVGIGPVKFDIGNFFASKASAVLDWCIHNADVYFDTLANWFIGHILTIEQLGGAAVSAIVHLGDQIAHIVTSVVPNAISAAESAAGAHAQSLVNGVERDLTGDFNTLTDTLKGDVKSIDSAIKTDVTNLTNLVSKSVTAGVAAAESYTDTVHDAITKFINKSVSDAETIAAGATADLARAVGGQLSTLEDTVAKNLTAAEGFATAAANTIYREVEGDLSSTAKTLQQGITAASTEAQTAITTAGQDLTKAEDFTTTKVGQAVTTTEQFASNAAGAAASTAEQALEGALGGIYTDLTGKALAVNGDLSTVEGLIAGAILTAVGSVAARVAKIEECYVGNCDDAPFNFSSLLKAALGFAEFAGVGAFLAQLVDNPAGAEQAYAGLVGGAFNAGQVGLEDLLRL